MSSTLERIESVEKKQAELDQKMNFIMEMMGNIQSLSQQVMSTEQSVISLGKTLTAVVKTLVAQKTLDSAEVMNHIIQIDSDSDREELERIKASGRVALVDVVDNECVVVASQNYINVMEPEKCKTISNFVLIRMPLPSLPEQLRADFQGRKVGDTLPTSRVSDSEFYAFTLKEIYKLKIETQGVEEAVEEKCDGDCTNCNCGK